MTTDFGGRIMRGLLLGVSFVALEAIPVLAQELQLEEITVTARKREEKLFETPLSITSLSSADIEHANIRDIAELAAYTPGFYYTQQAAFQAMRISPSLRFRGVNNGSGDPLLQQGGVFVDGVFLFGGAPSLEMDDVARVEVIKGPQSALFGRSTFAGAVNFVTKEPADHFTGSVTVDAETRGTYQLTGSIDAPITDKLSLRMSGGRNVTGAHFHTDDGGDLGYESTDTMNEQVLFKPSDEFQLRIRRWDNWQDDSRGAVVNMNPSNPLLANAPRVCQTGTNPYWCGAVPTLGDPGVNWAGLSMSTSLHAPAFAASNNPNLLVDILNNNLSNPLITGKGLPNYSDVPYLNHAGLAGKYERTSFESKYDFPNGMSLNADYVTSREASMSASTSSNDLGEGWVISPNILTDDSAEVRLNSDPNQRLNGLIGANYFYQKELNGLTGVGGLPSVNDSTHIASYAEPTSWTGEQTLMSYGTFASAHYSIFSQLAVDLEGRYQSDRVTTSYQLSTQTSTVFKAFTPRAILTYKPADGLMVYASWAEGKLPGTSNSLTPLLSQALQAQLFAIPGYTVNVGAEVMKNIEVGIKQETARWRYALTLYHMNWDNLKDSLTLVCPNNLCGPNLPGSSVGAIVPQQARIYGGEVEVGALITKAWDVNATADYVHSRYVHYIQPLDIQLTGTQVADGKTIVGFPEVQASLSTTYRGDLSADWGWYVRGDMNYSGRNYIDEVNQSWINPSAILNAHVGVEDKTVRVDLYSDNITDNRQWLGAVRAFQSIYSLGPARVTQATATVVLPRLRTFGIRITAKY